MVTIRSSVCFGAPFCSALRDRKTNQAGLLRSVMLVGVAEVGAPSGLVLNMMEADLHQIVREVARSYECVLRG